MARVDPVAPDTTAFETSVFINCPFDAEFIALLRPLVFTILYFGYTPRLASESLDSGENRLSKICRLIGECQYSVHDLSRIQAKAAGEFARMNMPFELGIDYGTRLHGSSKMRRKRFLILGKTSYDFKIAISDLAGFDAIAHNNQPMKVCHAVRNWLYQTDGFGRTLSRQNYWPTVVWKRFNDFTVDLHDVRLSEGLDDAEARKEIEEMKILEFTDLAKEWILRL